MMYDMTKEEKRILTKVRKAVKYADNGDPIKDAIDDREIIAALELLVKLVSSKPQEQGRDDGIDYKCTQCGASWLR